MRLSFGFHFSFIDLLSQINKFIDLLTRVYDLSTAKAYIFLLTASNLLGKKSQLCKIDWKLGLSKFAVSFKVS